MADTITRLASPIDAMYLIHKALRAQAARVEDIADGLNEGDSLQSFRLAFNSWATALVFHSEREDEYITVPFTAAAPPGHDGHRQTSDAAITALVGVEEALHRELVDSVQEVFSMLNDEIGRTSIITRTKQHLYRQVVTLRIALEDHLETEEALVLPVVRERMSDSKQLEVARALLIDEDAEDPRWIIDWVQGHLDGTERQLLAGLESRFQELPARSKSKAQTHIGRSKHGGGNHEARQPHRRDVPDA